MKILIQEHVALIEFTFIKNVIEVGSSD